MMEILTLQHLGKLDKAKHPWSNLGFMKITKLEAIRLHA